MRQSLKISSSMIFLIFSLAALYNLPIMSCKYPITIPSKKIFWFILTNPISFLISVSEKDSWLRQKAIFRFCFISILYSILNRNFSIKPTIWLFFLNKHNRRDIIVWSKIGLRFESLESWNSITGIRLSMEFESFLSFWVRWKKKKLCKILYPIIAVSYTLSNHKNFFANFDFILQNNFG